MASELETLMAIERSGDLNPVQRTRLDELKRSNPGVGEFVDGVPIFSFDYKKAAEEAYGELGKYYVRILEESRGDMNKALSRLTEDYDRGLRIRTEDRDRATQLATRRTTDNALARGIFQKSNFDPQGGRGVADRNLRENLEPINREFQRGRERADINLERQRTDIPEAQKRFEFAKEQERRLKAADLSERRGARAFQDFQARQLVSPDLV